MDKREFMTYLEYRRYCALNGIRPLKRKETGPFIEVSTLQPRVETPDSSLVEIFSILQEDGHLSRRLIEEFAGKVRVDVKQLMMIFDILGKEEITKRDFDRFMFSRGFD